MTFPSPAAAAKLQQRNEALANLRLNVATDIYARLIETQYQHAYDRAVEEADPFGLAPNEQPKLRLAMDLTSSVQISLDAADKFVELAFPS